MCTCPLKKQTACIIAHQLTLQPFIVPGKMHQHMHAHANSQDAEAGSPHPAKVRIGVNSLGKCHVGGPGWWLGDENQLTCDATAENKNLM